MALKTLGTRLRTDLTSRSERARMVRSAGMTSGLKVIATLLAFGASLVYARALGPHDYGLYSYVIAWAALLTIPVAMGLPSLMVREGARGDDLHALQRWSDKRVWLAGVVAGVALAAVWFVPQAGEARWLFVLAAPLPLLNGSERIRSALLRSQGNVARSEWPKKVAGPGLALAALTALWLARGTLHPAEVVVAMVAAAALQLAINGLQLRQLTAPGTNAAPTPGITVRMALPFLWLGGLTLLNRRIDLIMLGSLDGAHDTGLYAIASRAAELVPFVSAAASQTLAPRIARLWQEGDKKLLQRMLTGAARRVFIATLPLAAVFMIGADWLLGTLFGAEYTAAAIPLQILAGARLLSVVFGTARTLLNMAGQEKRSLIALSIAVAANLILNAVLIPVFGIIGAAIATGFSLVFSRILLWFWGRRHLGLNAGIFGH